MIRTVVIAVSLITFASSASAQSYLCQSTVTTGLDWENGQWVPTNFKEDTFLLKEVPKDQSTAFCHVHAEQEIGIPEWTYKNETYTHIPTCYTAAAIGEEGFPAPCRITKINGDLDRLSCEELDFKMNRNFEFFRSGSVSAISTSPPEQTRDSIFVSVGKCSAIE